MRFHRQVTDLVSCNKWFGQAMKVVIYLLSFKERNKTADDLNDLNNAALCNKFR